MTALRGGEAVMEILRVTTVECVKTFRKLRTYIGFVALGVIVPTLLVAFKLSHIERSAELGMMPHLAGFAFVGTLVNGLFLVRVILMSLFVHVPFLISLVSGDAIAGEATAGTLRLICVRPTSRFAIVTAKFAVSMLYCLLLVAFLGAIALGVGVLLFGRGPMLLSGMGITVVTEQQGYLRIALALLLGATAMTVVSALAFLFSVAVTNPIGPIIGTMAILIVFLIVSSTPLAFFQTVRPYLFTTYMSVWTRAFDAPLAWEAIGRDASVLIGYTLGLYSLAVALFQRKDIVT